MSMRLSPVAALLAQLELEPTGAVTFRAWTGEPEAGPYGRLFGGLIAAQALRAAQITVRAGHHVHSLHGYFLSPGKAGDPVTLEVDPLQIGRAHV